MLRHMGGNVGKYILPATFFVLIIFALIFGYWQHTSPKYTRVVAYSALRESAEGNAMPSGAILLLFSPTLLTSGDNNDGNVCKSFEPGIPCTVDGITFTNGAYCAFKSALCGAPIPSQQFYHYLDDTVKLLLDASRSGTDSPVLRERIGGILPYVTVFSKEIDKQQISNYCSAVSKYAHVANGFDPAFASFLTGTLIYCGDSNTLKLVCQRICTDPMFLDGIPQDRGVAAKCTAMSRQVLVSHVCGCDVAISLADLQQDCASVLPPQYLNTLRSFVKTSS